MATRIFDGIKFCEQLLTTNFPAKFGPNWPSSLGGKMFKEIVDNTQRTMDTAPSLKLPFSMLCSGELKTDQQLGGQIHRPTPIWLATRKKGHSDICVKCRPRMLIQDDAL